MGGSTSQTTNQSSQTNPWAPAIPMLSSILGQIGQGTMSPTGGQTAAANQVASEASGMPSFAGQGIGAVNNLFGGSTNPQQGILTGAYGQQQAALSPMLSAGYTNPMTNPALSGAMSTLNSDISNQIAGQFAAAGRPMGTNADSAQAMARGLSQGEAGLLANEFNTLSGNQLQAANQLGGAAGSTAGGLTQQQQAQLGWGLQGMNAASAIPGLLTQPGMANMTAQNMLAGLPLANLQQLEGLTLPIAGLGAQSQGTSTTQQQSPWWTTALGLGMLGSSLWPSDERIKENIEKVGELNDGQNVYAYNYKGDSTPHIGLLAQEVERVRPDAVGEFGGVKAVDYGKATQRSRMIGMLRDLEMAA